MARFAVSTIYGAADVSATIDGPWSENRTGFCVTLRFSNGMQGEERQEVTQEVWTDDQKFGEALVEAINGVRKAVES